MAQGNFAACLAVVLKLEGGYSDSPTDPGKSTNLGVTQATWQAWVGKNKVVTVSDIKALVPADVAPLYQSVFWKGCHADLLPAGVDLAVFDWSVNSGVHRGVCKLQEALGVTQDGLAGPMTLNAASAMPAAELIDKICDLRVSFYENFPNVAEREADLHGWLNRVATIRADAKAMITPT